MVIQSIDCIFVTKIIEILVFIVLLFVYGFMNNSKHYHLIMTVYRNVIDYLVGFVVERFDEKKGEKVLSFFKDVAHLHKITVYSPAAEKHVMVFGILIKKTSVIYTSGS